MRGLLDVGTHMSIIQLPNNKFLVVDTIEISPDLKAEIDQLTNNGDDIEAVVATHPFHTLWFPKFYELYPKPAYFGTPRHLRVQKGIPWKGHVGDTRVREQWAPEVQMRIPAGGEFENPLPESTNHFSSCWLYHAPTKTVHVDDTIMLICKPGFLLRLGGLSDGQMRFHPSMTGPGLYPHTGAPNEFRDWVLQTCKDWQFDNFCAAHMGNKLGGAHEDLRLLVLKNEALFAKLTSQRLKKALQMGKELPEDVSKEMQKELATEQEHLAKLGEKDDTIVENKDEAVEVPNYDGCNECG